jgi:hypothetical protein
MKHSRLSKESYVSTHVKAIATAMRDNGRVGTAGFGGACPVGHAKAFDGSYAPSPLPAGGVGRLALALVILVAGMLLAAGSASADGCPNEVFRTGPSAKLPDCRAYELVTPRYTGGIPPTIAPSLGTNDENLWNIEAVTAAGDDLLFNTQSGALPGTPGNGITDRYKSRRTAAGWTTEFIGVPAADVGFSSYPGGASPDHSYFFTAAVEPKAGLWAPWTGLPEIWVMRRPDGGFEPIARGSLGDDPKGEGLYMTDQASRIFFSSKEHLEPLAAPVGTQAIYERSAHGPTNVVSLLPGDQPTTQPAKWLGPNKDGSEVAFELGATFPFQFGSAIYIRRAGETEEAVHAGISPVGARLVCNGGAEPGSATLDYQWLRNGVAIGGATSASYVIVAADEGAVLQCQTTASSIGGKSSRTGPARVVEPYDGKNPPRPETPVSGDGQESAATASLTGDSTVGNELTCSATFEGGSATLSYKWLRDGVEVATGPTYTTVEADSGHVLQCRALAANADGASVVYSNAVTITPESPPVFPKATAQPTIANVTDPGSAPEVGDELSCANGTWSGSPSFAYRWLRDGSEIGGATSSTYTVMPADEGKGLQCEVTASNSVGTTRAVSNRVFFGSTSGAAAHPFLETFGSSAQPTFGHAEGLAVDQASGDLLVIDAGAGTVSRWKPDGTPDDFSALGTNVIDAQGAGDGGAGGFNFGGANEVQVAVDNSGTATNGDIYVVQSTKIDIFASSGEYIGQLSQYETAPGDPGTLTNFSESCGVAVDASGAVYVGDDFGGNAASKIHKYVPSANPPVSTDNTANLAYGEVCNVAAGAGPSAGSVFAVSYGGRLAKLDSSTGAEQYVVSTGVTTASVDPTTGYVYAVTGSQIKGFDASGATSTLVSTTALSSTGQGVATEGGSDELYVSEAGNSNISVYGPAVAGGAPDPLSAVSVTGSATVEGSLSCAPGAWTAEPTFAYQWLRNGEEIAGATSSSYTVLVSDLDKVIQCQVTATNSGGSTVGESPPSYITAGTPDSTASMLHVQNDFAGLFNGHLFYSDSSRSFEFTERPGGLYSYDVATHRSRVIANTGDASFVNVSEDGSHVYFARTFDEGGETYGKLYVWNRADDSTKLITELSGEDVTQFGRQHAGLVNWTRAIARFGLLDAGRGSNHTRSTPNGSALLFEATTQLTGFDNTEAAADDCGDPEVAEEPCDEVYRYDSNTDELVCVSCGDGSGPATGEANMMFSLYGAGEIPTVNAGFAAPNNLSADGGTAVFESTEALVPRDVNQTRDVYRWSVGIPTTALISTGQTLYPSFLYAVNPDASNIFIDTREQLLPEDENTSTQRIYDARVNGGFPPPEDTVTEPCNGDVCQGTPTASPEAPRIPSSSLNGTGNVKERLRCEKGTRRVVRHGRERCVKRRHHRKRHHRKHHKHAHRAGAHGRVGK